MVEMKRSSVGVQEPSMADRNSRRSVGLEMDGIAGNGVVGVATTEGPGDGAGVGGPAMGI